MIRPLLFFLAFFQIPASCAQALSTISSRWNNSFVEWDILIAPEQEDAETDEATEEELYGELKLRRLGFQEDFSEWTYELGGQRGTIRQKWKNDPSQWELRTYAGEVITMRASWSNDLSEWRITDNTISLTLGSRWKNRLDEWLVEDQRRGRFYVYTLREGDPRDWAIEDNLNEEVSEPMKMALLFTTIFQSTPKE
ncbi:MAG: hypothetical protein JNJ57_01610 [Saprospiraceae bacterium]|nr:hypothetical protein [Saprospiraceae bacterium]